MTDFERCQQAATASACPKKGADLLTSHHLELIRAAQLALCAATGEHSSATERDTALAVWQAAAERLAVALVSRLESLEEAPL